MFRLIFARHLQRFAASHDQVGNFFMHCRYHTNAQQKRALRTKVIETWESVTGTTMRALLIKLVILMYCAICRTL